MSRYLLVVLSGSLLLGLSGCDEDLLNPMAARQHRVDPYKKSGFYPDGLTMRSPPAGTVPRSRLTMRPELNAGKITAADGNDQYLTQVPIKVDAAFMALGKKRYDITCATCHGPLGDGDSIVATQMALKPPPSLMNFSDRPVGYIFDVATNGFGMMASYAAELPVRERWAVVAYVRALQISQSRTVEDVPAADRGTMKERVQ